MYERIFLLYQAKQMFLHHLNILEYLSVNSKNQVIYVCKSNLHLKLLVKTISFGYGYKNATSMLEMHGGVQRKIKLFVHCRYFAYLHYIQTTH